MLIQHAVAKMQCEALPPVMIEFTAKQSSLVAFKISLDTLCTTVNTQRVGNERAAQALRQLRGTVKGGFSTVLELLSAVDPIGKAKGNGKAVKFRAFSGTASGSASGASGGSAFHFPHALDEK